MTDTTQVTDTLILKTGSATGTYQKIGCQVARVLEEELPVRVILVTGKGSGENVQDLTSGWVDMAIAQSDIAHHAWEGEGQFDRSWWKRWNVPERGIRAVLGLHLEQVLVVGRGENRNTFDDVRQTDTMVVGTDGSGTQGNAKDLLAEILGESPDSLLDTPQFRKSNPRQVLEASRAHRESLKSGRWRPREVVEEAGAAPPPDSLRWDVLFQTAYLDAGLKSMIREAGARVLPMNEELRRRLASKHPYYLAAPADSTVSIRALLLARPGLDQSLVETIVKAFREDIGSPSSKIRNAHPSLQALADSSLTEGASVPIHSGAAKIYCEDLGKACAYSPRYLRARNWSLLGVLLGSLMILMAFVPPVRRLFLRWNPGLATRLGPDGILARWRWVLIFVFAFGVLVFGAIAVTSVELFHVREARADSPFANRTFWQNLLWLGVFAASGYENRLFPVSIWGQIISSGTVVVALAGSIFLTGVVTSKGFARRMRMDMRHDLSVLRDHVIVCGWNRRGPGVLRTLCDRDVDRRRMRLVVVADLEDDPLEDLDLPPGSAQFLKGSPTLRENMVAAGLAGAETVLVLADDAASEEDRDARTLMVAAQVEKYVHALVVAGERTRELYTVAELVDPQNREVFTTQFIDQIHCQQEIEERVLAQSVLNPGLTRFMDEILAENESNEVYEVPVIEADPGRFRGLTFDEALSRGRSMGFLLLAIRSRGDGNGVAPSFVVNPASEDERQYRISTLDSLLVLAESEDRLVSAFGPVSGWRGALL